MSFRPGCHKPTKLGEGLNPICKNCDDFGMRFLLFVCIFMLNICLDDARFIL